jgi:hypothetical protein
MFLFTEIIIETHFSHGVSSVEVVACTSTGESSIYEGDSVTEAIEMARRIRGEAQTPILMTAETKVALEHTGEKLPWNITLAKRDTDHGHTVNVTGEYSPLYI